MTAIILNSGLGNRMGALTSNCHKSLIKLSNGESIFSRQIRILSECGITDFIITTGPFEEQLIDVSKKFKQLKFTFVNNPNYKNTNYIYSLHLIRDYVDDDCLLLHGDLVFNRTYVEKVLSSNIKSLGSINKTLPLPQKDFKAFVENNLIKKISISIFDEGCFAFQPFYKLSKHDINLWISEISEFCNLGITGVYAEEALNKISSSLCLSPFSYEHDFVDEVDTIEDLKRVSEQINLYDYRDQIIKTCDNNYDELKSYCKVNNITNPLFISGKTTSQLPIVSEIKSLFNNYSVFSNFSPNPSYEQALEGLFAFKSNSCDGLIAIGGGSAIDIAKAVKAFYSSIESDNYIQCSPTYSDLKLICLPTTAGTGSESTKFSVIYYKGEKKSLDNINLLPNFVMLYSSILKHLPLYQKKCTLFDALSQCIESIWAINATEYSQSLAVEGLSLLLSNFKDYFDENPESYSKIMYAANLSGKAINISKTTAAHAMSYKLSQELCIPHGHAVILCLPKILKLSHAKLNTLTGESLNRFIKANSLICKAFNKDTLLEVADELENLINELDLNDNISIDKIDVISLAESVNVERLNNNPIKLSMQDIISIYEDLFF